MKAVVSLCLEKEDADALDRIVMRVSVKKEEGPEFCALVLELLNNKRKDSGSSTEMEVGSPMSLDDFCNEDS